MAAATTREEGDVDETEGDKTVTVPASAVQAVSPAVSATAAAAPAGDDALVRKTAEKSSYQTFLDRFRHPSSQDVINEVRDFVTDFPNDLTRLQAAQRVHDFLSVTTPRLAASEVFVEERSEEARRGVEEHFERFVLTKLHKVLYRNLPADIKQDEIADQRLQEKQQASAGRGSLGPELSEESQELFVKATDCLRMINQYQIPGSKVICMLNAYRLVDNVVEELRWKGEAAATNTVDDANNLEGSVEEGTILRRVLQALVIEAAPPNFFSNVEFAAAFRHPPRTTAEERRCLRDFSAALGAATGVTPRVPTLAIGAGGSWTWGGFEDLPLWLEGTGVSFRFEGAEAGNLLIGEVDELLGAYHRMASVLGSLAERPEAAT